MTGGDFKEDSPEVYVAVTLDRIGERYGLLPSEVLQRATTLDIMVMDISISFERYKEHKQLGKTPEIPQEDLMQALQEFKDKNGN